MIEKMHDDGEEVLMHRHTFGGGVVQRLVEVSLGNGLRPSHNSVVELLSVLAKAWDIGVKMLIKTGRAG